MGGVTYRTGARRKPFQAHVMSQGRRTTRVFATAREAVVAQLACRICRRVVKRISRGDLEGKRAHDLGKHGHQCAMEREVADALVAEWTRQSGAPAFVLNDGTRADVILGRGDAGFLPVQVKTTGKNARKNSWKFHGVGGYADMPVVCWRCDREDAWVYDGAALEGRKFAFDVSVGGRNDALAMAKGLGMTALVQYLREHAARWASVAEHDARRDFCSDTHAKEMRGIDAFCAAFPTGTYSWPSGQNTHVDLLDGETRLQFKTAHALRGKAGFQVNMNTSSGKDLDGRQLKAPYPRNAFDVLVVVWFVGDGDGVAHFWRIPADVLAAHGILSDADLCAGKKCFYVHGVPGVGQAPQEGQICGRKVDLWSREFYVGPFAQTGGLWRAKRGRA